MCGINGFNFSDEKLIKLMNKSINHRGPDDSDIFFNKYLSLGQVRLSILDLSDAGRQPLFYDKNLGASNSKFNSKNIILSNLSIVFNGEIYNYLEIKEELEKLGYKFTTSCDTEVILASYLEWGEKCVDKFNGMWAFVIYDKEKNILFCSRDRLGVKPFYYYLKNGNFIFSSELKGILQHKEYKINSKNNINKEAFELYFALGFIPSPFSIFNDVFKLEASHNLVFDLNKKEIINKYKYYEICKYEPVFDKKKLIEEGRELLKDSVKLRMRSDVPVGAFLSGGLDSSSVVGVMKDFTEISKLHTFSIGFEGKYDETPYINIVKNYFKTKHHHYYFKEKDFKNLLNEYSFIYDEPFGDFSGFPTLKVSEIAKKYVSVSLSGDGGDEIFGGYNTHKMGSQMDLIRKIPKPIRVMGSKIPARKNLNGFANVYLLKKAFEVSLKEKHLFYSSVVSEDRYKPLVFKTWTENSLKKSLELSDGSFADGFRIYDLLYSTLADNFLVKVDRASMKYALEVRSPFLDYRFAEFAQKIPVKWKNNSFKTKILMREIIKDILPLEILNRGKQGFTPPLEEWILSDEYKIDLEKGFKILKNLDIDLYQYYNEKVFKENNKVYNIDKIKLYLFYIWYKKWVS